MYISPGIGIGSPLCHFKKMACQRIIYFFVLLSATCSQTDGKLIAVPRDTVSKVNHTVYFNCSTTLKSEEMFWLHESKYVYAENKMLKPYDVRFKTEHNNGECNLVIQSVEPDDAGEYSCSEEDFEEKPSAQLIVIDNDPICESDMTSGEEELSCRVSFHGSRPPAMEWKKIGDAKAITENISTVSSGNTHIITLRPIHLSLNKSSYVCQITDATPSPYKCSPTNQDVWYHGSTGTDHEYMYTSTGQNIVLESFVVGETVTLSQKFFVIAGPVFVFLTIVLALVVAVMTIQYPRAAKKRMGNFIAVEVRNDLRSCNIAEKDLDIMIEKWNNNLGKGLRKGESSNAAELRSALLINSSDTQKSMTCESTSRKEIVSTEISVEL